MHYSECDSCVLPPFEIHMHALPSTMLTMYTYVYTHMQMRT